jgi:hypothetical protein
VTATKEALEAQLVASFTDENLAVYADLLQAEGDPRGELFVLERQIEDFGSTPALVERRRDKMREWLGMDPDAPELAHCLFMYGFAITIELDNKYSVSDRLALLERLLARVGRHTEQIKLTSWCDEPFFCQAIDLVLAGPRPFLDELELAHYQLGDCPDTIDRARMERLAIVAPALQTLDVYGRRLCEAFDHPALRRLSDSYGLQGIAGLGRGPATMPSVRELTIHRYVPRSEVLATALPNLEQLTLKVDPSEELFGFLEHLPRPERIQSLTLRMLTTYEQAARVQAVIDRMPALATLTISRAHKRFGQPGDRLRHPTAAISLPPVFPWPANVSGSVELAIGDIRLEPLGLEALSDHAAIHYHELDASTIGAWDTLWAAITSTIDLPPQPHAAVSTEVLRTALGSIPGPNPWGPTIQAVVAQSPNVVRLRYVPR